MTRLLAFFLLWLAAVAGGAQRVAAWYVIVTGEEQYNATSDRWNFTSLLDYGVDLRLWRGAQLNVGALTSYMQHEEGYLLPSPLAVSNVDAPTSPFRIAVLGLSQQVGPVSLFAGVSNTVINYFADPELAFFVGPPHGIQPTLSYNFDIATYPTAALAAQATWQIDTAWRLRATLYNGAATDRLSQLPRLGQGALLMAAVNRHDARRTTEAGVLTGRGKGDDMAAALYAYHIEHLSSRWCLIGEAGAHIGDNKGQAMGLPEAAAANAALGGIYTLNERHSLGLTTRLGVFDEGYANTQMELTYQYSRNFLTLQPVLLIDHDNTAWNAVGMLRLTLAIERAYPEVGMEKPKISDK